ncbi:holo-[acyl-carrier-protein] synthase [candidate division WOR-1 bacterium RIFCSPLOWO2_02_FULL_46_20]|uniref:Holo-[acyl-carrier-protein] synthase n=2 Tax=Saganbacteria TaxID=1703751 RepID=A0A1F4RD49_UNCSA|nr:MAG: holo-[acyl-carrier-protein] synthase [candidate division WOR-1 bacterium RIFCSPHIGHO2_02_FULL_45_12]OGC06115.1 MAG: holo-[acyl-carrier-protein] synthase [candidate division WOR-1 bacterium RIFCSPLOWO2_02_FULL_46_20]OGC09389.1 MAG: holo-[acyl-carrier-protein] synthase [candidate division WOR-1 bacterium RIFCSPLOWO2_12_FULL_45_9]
MKGIGVDIIEIERIKESVKKYGASFLNKVFTLGEIEYCRKHKAMRFPELAVRFAAKEAYSKAVGTGITGPGEGKNGLGWHDIEVANESSGRPFLCIKGKKAKKVLISLSHSRDYAVAAVYVEE